jgi:hypothetical protein
VVVDNQNLDSAHRLLDPFDTEFLVGKNLASEPGETKVRDSLLIIHQTSGR